MSEQSRTYTVVAKRESAGRIDLNFRPVGTPPGLNINCTLAPAQYGELEAWVSGKHVVTFMTVPDAGQDRGVRTTLTVGEPVADRNERIAKSAFEARQKKVAEEGGAKSGVAA